MEHTLARTRLQLLPEAARRPRARRERPQGDHRRIRTLRLPPGVLEGVRKGLGAFLQWDGVYFAPVKEEKKEALKKEDAGEILRQLVTLDDPAMKNVIYVLAVMLERSKILVERDAKELEDGTIRRVYEDRKQGDTFVILDPRIRLENLAEVQGQVVALLSGTKTLGEVAKEEEGAPDGAETQADGGSHGADEASEQTVP